MESVGMKNYTRTDYDDGTFEDSETYTDPEGLNHREGDKPAVRQHFQDGSETLRWYIHGVLARPTGGPVVVHRSSTGEVVFETFPRNRDRSTPLSADDPRLG